MTNHEEEKLRQDPLGNFLRRNAPQPPVSPGDEYLRLSNRIGKSRPPGGLSRYFSGWILALAALGAMALFFLWLPRGPAPRPIAQASVQGDDALPNSIFEGTTSLSEEELRSPHEDWLFLAEAVVSKPR